MKDLKENLLVGFISLIVLVWTIFPIYNMIITSFKPWREVWMATYFPHHPTLEAYITIINQSYFRVHKYWLWLWNSIRVSLEVMVLGALIGLLAGYTICERSALRSFIKGTARMISLLVYIFPASLLSIPIYILLMNYRLLNTDIGLALSLATLVSPFNAWMAAEYLNSIPKEIEEAALVDGASTFQVYFKILLPLIRPAIIALSVYSFIFSWNNYLYPLLIIQDEDKFLLPVALGAFLQADDDPWHIFFAAGLIYAVPPLVLYYAFRRYLVSGLFRGAVKI